MGGDTAVKAPGPRARIVIVVAVVIAIVLWLILRGGGDDNKTSTQASQPVPQRPGLPAVALDTTSLKNYAKGEASPVYWVGSRNDRRYEVTRTNDGATYVRYLPPGVKAGDSRAAYLTVGTYPSANPQKAIDDGARTPGSTVVDVPGGGRGWTKTKNNIYIAFPQVKQLIEVWDPNEGRALQLAKSGEVVPVR